jgi:hypothetical protein
MTMKLEVELKAAGCSLSAQAFRDIVIGVFDEHYAGWTDERLVCDTPEATKFVQLVRAQLGRRIPAVLINQTLINIRKASRRVVVEPGAARA